jgi:hypothetical protein
MRHFRAFLALWMASGGAEPYLERISPLQIYASTPGEPLDRFVPAERRRRVAAGAFSLRRCGDPHTALGHPKCQIVPMPISVMKRSETVPEKTIGL